ncbi:hypothetical protein [Natronorubrum bangense]|nr:hypothetical protein [Natronorubrum bangense]
MTRRGDHRLRRLKDDEEVDRLSDDFQSADTLVDLPETHAKE